MADLTRPGHRTKVMAMIGSMIGFMFALSLVGAPLLYQLIGMDGLFVLTGVLCLVAVAVVRYEVRDPPALMASAFGRAAVFASCAGLVVLWLLLAWGMRPVPSVNPAEG